MIDRAECVRLYQEHKSTTKVAVLLNCHPENVRYHLMRAGIKLDGVRTYLLRGGRTMSERVQETIRLLRDTPTMSRSELARALDVSIGSLGQIVQMARLLAPDLPARLADARQGSHVHHLQGTDARETVRQAIIGAKSWREAAQVLDVTLERLHFLKRHHQLTDVPFNQRARVLQPGVVRAQAVAELTALGWSQVAIGVALAVSRQRIEQIQRNGAPASTQTLVRDGATPAVSA